MTDTVIIAPGSDEVRNLRISWTAIFSGWLVALGFAWLFYITGIAVGFSAFDVNAPEAVAKGIGIGTTLWVILTWAVSLFFGGMFASWVDARPNASVGALHGVAVWGLASSMTLLLAAMGFTGLLQGAAGLLRTTAVAGAAAAASSGQSGAVETPLSRASGLLGAQLTRAVTQPATGQPAPAAAAPASADATTSTAAPPPAARSTSVALSRDASAAVSLDLLRGRNDEAKARLVAETGMPPTEVDAVLKNLSAQVENQKAQIKEAADQVRRYSAAALWAVVLSTLIGLIAAAIGGSFGAGQVARVHPVLPRI